MSIASTATAAAPASAQTTHATPATPRVVDRYISFKGIDYDGNVRRVLDHLARYRRADPDNRLLDYLERQRSRTTGVQRDDLLLLHSLCNAVRDLFEAHDDDAALADLDRLEVECF